MEHFIVVKYKVNHDQNALTVTSSKQMDSYTNNMAVIQQFTVLCEQPLIK